MNESGKLFAIAVLAVTAVLLLCTMVILDRMPANPAFAGSSPDRSPGDYLMVPGATAQGDDCVYVVDIAVQKVWVFKADFNKQPNNGVIPFAKLDLAPPKP